MSHNRTGLFFLHTDHNTHLPPATQSMDENPEPNRQLPPYAAYAAGAAIGGFFLGYCLARNQDPINRSLNGAGVRTALNVCLCVGACVCALAITKCCTSPRR